MYGIAPKLPIIVTKRQTPMATLTIEENTKQNLKNLILTAPGERVMDINFGVGLRRYLFEPDTPTNKSKLQSRIREQVSRYIPFIKITELQVLSSPDSPGVLNVLLRYDIQNIASNEILSLSLDPKITS